MLKNPDVDGSETALVTTRSEVSVPTQVVVTQSVLMPMQKGPDNLRSSFWVSSLKATVAEWASLVAIFLGTSDGETRLSLFWVSIPFPQQVREGNRPHREL